ncbi:MAG TPA: trigger factor [Bacillota bacterium]|nr:trigger factor [Bacillota bacterium]
MKATMLGREKNDVSFKMDFDADEFENALVNAYKATRHQYNIDGFRKGKAPRKLIETKYGDKVFYEDAINRLFSDGYPAALKELTINPVDSPSADFDEIEGDKGFGVTVKVAVHPIVDVKNYKGIKVDKIDDSVSDEDVEKDLAALQKRNSRMIVADRPAKEGDTLLIDYAGFIGEEQFEGGSAERQTLTLGSNAFIPGFEEQLIGSVAGEERDVNVTFPDEYHSETLSGREAVFKCKIHEIKETELPVIDDEFAKDVSEFETLGELKTDIRHKLEKIAKDKAEYETKNAVLEKIYEETEIDIPDIMISDQTDDMLQEIQQQMRYQGIDLHQYLGYLNKDIEEYREELKPEAYKKVKTRLIVEAVAGAEELTASEEDIEKELEAMAEQYKMEIDNLKKTMGENGIAYLRQDIRNRKAVDFLYENAVIG